MLYTLIRIVFVVRFEWLSELTFKEWGHADHAEYVCSIGSDPEFVSADGQGFRVHLDQHDCIWQSTEPTHITIAVNCRN